MWGIFLGVFQCLLVNDCPAASCDSGVLARRNESTSFYSAVLVPNPSIILNIEFQFHSIVIRKDSSYDFSLLGFLKTSFAA